MIMNREPVAVALDSCAEALRTLAMALRNGRDATGLAPVGPDRLLTADQAAGVLGVNRRWLYRNAPRLPFARHLSRRALRFSEAGLHRWIERRQ
jgi:predicted DNA-binding transcriptional regulator AlpA